MDIGHTVLQNDLPLCACECMCYLFRCSHEVDSGVVSVIFLKQAEGKLVIDQQVV